MGEKRFSFSAVEMAVLNSEYKGHRMARIEVFDRDSDSPYQDYEAYVKVPEEFFNDFIKVFDMKESDLMPKIIWDYETEMRKRDEES